MRTVATQRKLYLYATFFTGNLLFPNNVQHKTSNKIQSAGLEQNHDLNKYTNKEKKNKHIFILLEACAGSTISRFGTNFWGRFSRGVPQDAVLLAK